MSKNARFALCALPLLWLGGCSGNGPPTRTVSGQLVASAYTLDNPVVIAQSLDHRTFVRHLDARGGFAMALPAGTTYRLTLANTTRTGAYRAISRINWPTTQGRALWARISLGNPLKLGPIHPTFYCAPTGGGSSCSGGGGAGSAGSGGGSGGYGGDDHHEGDHHEEGDSSMCGSLGEGEHHDDEGEDDDHCEKDKAVQCDDSAEVDSDCDGEHEHDSADADGGSSDGKGDGNGDHEGCDKDDDGHESDIEHESSQKCQCMTTPPPGGASGGGSPSGGGGTPPGGGSTPPSTPSGANGPCTVNADCAAGLLCMSSSCTASMAPVK